MYDHKPISFGAATRAPGKALCSDVIMDQEGFCRALEWNQKGSCRMLEWKQEDSC